MSFKQKGFIAGGAAGAAVACAALAWASGHGSAALASADVSQGITPPAAAAPMSFANIIQRVSPAVVSIDVTGRADPSEVAMQGGAPFSFSIPGMGGFPGMGGDDEDQGDGGPVIPFGRQGPRAAPKMQATGSGFFISSDGYIVTNNHVIKGAETITVRTADKRVLKGHLVGHDPATDIAVVKVDGTGFPFVDFEKSASPRVGDWVIAVGNPFGLGGTATAGIVSALGRENVDETRLVDYMQIDAPINRGNSGGPTFDVYGRVVGVNTAIYSPSGGSVGIGFDIPADVASGVAKKLIAHGKVEHGYIGATIQEVNAEVADSLGLKAAGGALVAGLSPAGPAARAGLQQGDVVLSVNGRTVASASDLTRQVAFSSPGEDLRLDVLRNGRRETVTIHTGVRPSEAQLAKAEMGGQDEDGAPAPGQASGAKVLGMSLAALDASERQQLGLSDAAHGVVVTRVDPNSDAAEKGIAPGDVIVKAGSHASIAPADVAKAVADAKGAQRSAVLLMVNRNGQTAFVPVKVRAEG